METKNIYTNGTSLFTLENYSLTAGMCHPHNITLHGKLSKIEARAMHERGQLHYITGSGDRKEIAGIALNRKLKLKNFKIN